MVVYILTGAFKHEGSDIIGVFSTTEKAKERLAASARDKIYDSLDINEYVVDNSHPELWN